MKAAYRPVVDPVFESVMREGGPLLLSIRRTTPTKRRRFDEEANIIEERGAISRTVCDFSVMKYALLTDSHAVFSSYLQLAQSDYNFQERYTSHKDPEVRKRAELRKKEIIDNYKLEMEFLKDRKEKFVIRYKNQTPTEYGSSMLSDAVTEVRRSAEGFGIHARIEMCARVVGWLDGHTRRTLPEFGEFIDLMIKSVLASERSRRARSEAWRRADLRETETLRPEEVLLPLTRRQRRK